MLNATPKSSATFFFLTPDSTAFNIAAFCSIVIVLRFRLPLPSSISCLAAGTERDAVLMHTQRTTNNKARARRVAVHARNRRAGGSTSATSSAGEGRPGDVRGWVHEFQWKGRQADAHPRACWQAAPREREARVLNYRIRDGT